MLLHAGEGTVTWPRIIARSNWLAVNIDQTEHPIRASHENVNANVNAIFTPACPDHEVERAKVKRVCFPDGDGGTACGEVVREPPRVWRPA
jgi:hypothetical protein